MDLVHGLLHLDKFLPDLIGQYHTWIYGILFFVLFAETGLVVMPFLPGDSLLFTVGSLTAQGIDPLYLSYVFPLLFVAVFLGDNVNYWIGRTIGPRMPFLNQKHLDRTHAFFEKYGSRAVVYARFAPIIRTFTPFVAGVGAMPYLRFLTFSVMGCLLWLTVCLSAGYYFGSLPFVKKHFDLVVLAIIAISFIPAVLEYMKHRRADAEEAAAGRASA